MAHLKLRDLDFKKIRNWVKRADDKQSKDPLYSFISAWIGFNYYYSTFAKEHRQSFIDLANKNRREQGDKSQWTFLIHDKNFIEFFDNFRNSHSKRFDEKVKLPVINMLNGKGVPEGLEGEYSLRDLNTEQIFSVIYQIRNNLFHGDKDPAKDKRDMQLSKFASKFLVPFLIELIENTYGEVKNASESFKWQIVTL
ncbi:MAG: hypothetical protein WA977_08325 [Halobacteriota archaeon]